PIPASSAASSAGIGRTRPSSRSFRVGHVVEGAVDCICGCVSSCFSLDALVQAAKEKTPSYAAVIATAGYTGGRIREVLALRWCDIDHTRGIVHLRGQVDAEGTTVVEPKTPE